MAEDMDRNDELMLDGNAAAALWHDLFGVEMTAMPTECAHCATVNDLGALRVFDRGPGVILRCPACGQIMLRVVRADDALLLDARGVTYLRIARQ